MQTYWKKFLQKANKNFARVLIKVFEKSKKNLLTSRKVYAIIDFAVRDTERNETQ